MISSFSGATRNSDRPVSHHFNGSNLPIPFNIPNVLHNLLFEDIGIKFDAKQQDMVDTLKFSTKALVEFNEKHYIQEQELSNKLFHDPDSAELEEEYEELQLDFYDANHHYRDLVVTISEMLSREQYAKLLKFSNIPV